MQEIIKFLVIYSDLFKTFITFVSLVVTIANYVANSHSAKATQGQLDELKRQHEEEHRAFISHEFIYECKGNTHWYGLRFTNHGKRVATNVRLQLDKDFIDSLMDLDFKEYLRELDGKEFSLGIKQSYDIYFGRDKKFTDRLNKIPIQGTISYKDRNSLYIDSFYIDFSKYPSIFPVATEGEQIKEEMKKLNKSVSDIKSELKYISRVRQQQNTDNTGDIK